MADKATSALPEAQTLSGSDFLLAIVGGVTSKISVANAQKVLGGGGGGSGSVATGNTNFIRTPGDFGDFQDWLIYDSGSGKIVINAAQDLTFPADNSEHSIYQGNTKSQVPNGTYTFGFTCKRLSGAGKLRAAVYTEGESKHYNAPDQDIQDNTEYVSSVTVTVTDAATNTHFAIDGGAGLGGRFLLSKITAVTGSSYNPSAT